MEQIFIDRINELARKAKEAPLSPEEAAEQKKLRAEYIAEWRKSTLAVLESTYIVDEHGNKRKLQKKD